MGNILATISDKKIGVSLAQDSSLIDHYEADVKTAQDYYPFGMIMPGRMLAILSIPGGSFSGTTQVNGYTLPVDLTLSSRSGNQPTSYVASDFIDLNDGFESGTNDDVTAYIADGSYAGGGNGSNDNAVAGGGYRYGFNGKENNNEVKGVGDQIDYGMRVYDPRIGKFLSVDPLYKEYPWYTPYQFSGNNPILFIDADGKEPATPEQKHHAIEMINEYAVKNGTLRVFSNVTKQGVVNDLARQINTPEKSVIPVGSGWYCGMYAFAYAYTYYDPEGFTKGVLDLVQTGKAKTAGGKDIKASQALRDLNINDNISPFIFSAAVRETYNNFLNASSGGKAVWAATGSGDMKKMLGEVGNLNVKEFSYGHEETMDGITNEDIGVLKKHTDGGNIALLRVSYNQFKSDKDEFGQGMEATFSGGDHWVVLTGIVDYDIDKNTITINVYDDHQGLQTNKTMTVDKFKDMIYHVLMVEPQKEEPSKK